ncbi:MAG: FAD-binding oxidoreductase [Campylobacterota bacterium]|nr:FAD-binding oxidoreductase [Campylobacterota bacterium]
MYDIAIIGAGINGCSVAYEFSSVGKRVVIFDKDNIASGGSGAAGAFISPKFSKAGELKELIHDAFIYSMKFYEKNFSSFLTKAQLIHIAQDESSSEILKKYKENTPLTLKKSPFKTDEENISLDAGIVDAKKVCQALSKDAKFIKENVDSLVYDKGNWIINERHIAKKVILATGAYKSVMKEPYIKLRGIWGHRCDIKTTTKNEYSLHQFVSISPSNDDILAIGATHNIHYHPDTSALPYDVQEGRTELLEKASRTINLENIEIIKDYTGLRSGSFDYIPMLGRIVLSSETLSLDERKLKTKKPNYDEYTYYPNLYMINGNGGYGFVLAPYLAKMLSEEILEDKKISDRLSPARFFARWAKKR